MKRLLYFLSVLLLPLLSVAQLPGYDFEVDFAPYQSVDPDLVLTTEEAWSEIFVTIPLEFSFPFFGEVMDTLWVVELSSVLVDSATPGSEELKFLSPFLWQLESVTDNFGMSLSTVSYTVSGDAGSRMGILQYENAGVGTEEHFCNFQIHFYEANGCLEFHYGASSLPSTDQGLFYTALLGNDWNPDLSENPLYYLEGNEANPIWSSIITDSVEELALVPTLNEFPIDGRIYRFKPNPPYIGIGETPASITETKMYPNITDGAFTIELPSNEPSELVVHDLTGKVVMTELLRNKTNNLDASALESGIYLVTVSQGAERVTKRLVKK